MSQAPIAPGRARGPFAFLVDNATIMLSTTMICWAGNFIIGRWSSGHVPPIMLAWSRWTLAALILLPFCWRKLRADLPAIRTHWKILLLLGLTGAGLFNSLQYLALNHTIALNALLINSSGPVFIALACLTLFGDRIGLGQWLGISLSMLGVLLVGTRGDIIAIGTFQFALGDILMLIAMVTWGVYTAFLRKRPAIHFLSFAVVQMIIASAINAPFVLWESALGAELVPSLRSLISIAYCAVFPSIIAYLCYFRGVQLIGGARAGAYIHLTTLFGAILSIVLLGESMQPYHIAGFVLIVAGVMIATRFGRPA